MTTLEISFVSCCFFLFLGVLSNEWRLKDQQRATQELWRQIHGLQAAIHGLQAAITQLQDRTDALRSSQAPQPLWSFPAKGAP